MIFLRPSLRKAHPDLTRFITAHEAAHLARDDVTSEGLAVACLAPSSVWPSRPGRLTCGGFTHPHSP